MNGLTHKNFALAYTIAQACEAAGIGRTNLYAAVKAGDLVARKRGRRTVILADELLTFLRSLPRMNSDRVINGQPDLSGTTHGEDDYEAPKKQSETDVARARRLSPPLDSNLSRFPASASNGPRQASDEIDGQ